MEDILILSSKQSHTASLWVNYLTSCFEQISKQHNRAPFKILSVILEDLVGSDVTFPPIMEEKMVHVKLQIVIMCPQFLEHIYQHPGPSTSLGQILKPDRVLAMMLGVDEDAITEQHRAALISYPQWNRLPVLDQDETFVKNFIEVAMNILAKVWRQNRVHTDKSRFSLLPKKVKEGQNKVIVLLNDPISKEDKIKVTVEKNGDKIDILTMKRKNPYTLHFQMPDCCLKVSMIVNVYVEKNGEQLGCRQVKCESRMRELDQILRSLDDPLLFMCQTLGFSPGDREHLDNFLVTALQRNIPKHFNLLHMPMVHHRSHTSNEEYPTLLHFSARFGLEKLSWQLLECPGGEQACEIRNICEMTPAEMAEGAGHVKLANALRGYMQMTELTSMYSYLKSVSESNAQAADFEMTEYHSPRPLSETYLIPPSMPRPVTNHYEIPPSMPRPVINIYQVPPTARPFSPSISPIPQDTEDIDTGGYLTMHASRSKLSSSPAVAMKDSIEMLSTISTSMSSTDPVSSFPPQFLTKQPFSRQNSDQVSLHSSRSDEDKESTASSSRKKSREQSREVQDELIEIINDFKNNVFTISEVEKLVESWRNRNDVQQSFKEKQEQLSHMREEYERIQATMSEEMKRPTPFDRVRNFFRGKPKVNKSKENSNDTTSEENKVMNINTLPVYMRPLSSLSLHSTCSSSSSGRMSTASGCSGVSLGDSGTHSDIEDRKQAPSVIYEGRSNGISNYEIPPAPRPVPGQNYNTTTTKSVQDLVKTRPPQPPPRPETPEYIEAISEDYVQEIEITKQVESSSETSEKIQKMDNNSLNNKTNLPLLHIEEPNSTNENTMDKEYMNFPYPRSTAGNSSAKAAAQTAWKSSDNIYESSGPSQDDSPDIPNYINIITPMKKEKRQPAPRTLKS